MEEDIFLDLLKRSGVEQPVNVISFSDHITSKETLKKIKEIEGPGVYIIKGLRSDFKNSNTEEVLYIGRTRSKTRNVGARIHEQLTSDDHSFRKNILRAGYTLCFTYDHYNQVV